MDLLTRRQTVSARSSTGLPRLKKEKAESGPEAEGDGNEWWLTTKAFMPYVIPAFRGMTVEAAAPGCYSRATGLASAAARLRATSGLKPLASTP